MNNNYVHEINLIDMIIDWISHWRSLAIILLAGILLLVGYKYIRNGDETVTSGDETVTSGELIESVENLAESATLSALSPSQLKEVSLDDMEKYFLSEKDINAVDEVIGLYEEYLENVDKYEVEKVDLELTDRAEALNYLLNAKNLIETRKSVLTPDQQIYYYKKLGISSVAGEAGDENETELSDRTVEATELVSTKKAALIVVLALFIHFVIVTWRYIFDKRIKRTDMLSSMVNVPEFTRIINWERIDSKRGLDRLVSNIRFASVRRTEYSDVIGINALAVIEKLNGKNHSSVAVVGPGLDIERKDFSSQISKTGGNIVVKSIDSITHSVDGANDIVGVKAAILAVKVGYTRYSDFFEELNSLKDRGIDVLGIAVFE